LTTPVPFTILTSVPMNTDDLILLPRPAQLIRNPGTCGKPSRALLPDRVPDLIRERAMSFCTNESGPVLIMELNAGADSPEAYRLASTQAEIKLESEHAAGLWYGLQTLGQLAAGKDDLPCVEIVDTPDFPERGFMLDISRNKVPTMDSLFKLVDLLSSLKINQLQLYTEHTFAFTGHELVWGDASPMTGEQIRALDAYCRDRYIELVPNQNSFGHMERWLRWPEYHHLAESPHGWNINEHLSKDSGTVLKPNDESLAFVDSLHRELLPNFSSRKFNIGCDETWELGLGWSRPEVKKVGKQEVYLRFLTQLAEQVKGHGRQPLFWADILLKETDSIKRLPKDMIPVIWGYEANHPFDKECPLVANSGYTFHVAPGTSTWKTLTGNLTNAFPNLRNAAQNGRANGANGYLITNWGDLGGIIRPGPSPFPGLAYGAALAWSFEANTDVDLAPALGSLFLGDPSGILSKTLLEAGSLDTRFPECEGKLADRLFQVFFSHNRDLSHHLRGLQVKVLENVSTALDELRKQADSFAPATPETSLARDEVLLSIDMARYAIRRGHSWLEHIENGKSLPSTGMRSCLQELIGRFEAVWLMRNRPRRPA
jgi:hexosaminidase